MVRKGSQLVDATRQATPSWKLLYGADTDPASATRGIIGKMRHADAGFTGIAATSMNSEGKMLAPSQFPAVDVFARAIKTQSRKVSQTPPLIITFRVTWVFYSQAANFLEAHFDLEHYQMKVRELIRNANNSGNTTFYDFGVPSFIYFIGDSNVSSSPPEKFRLPGGGEGYSANVSCDIMVKIP